MKTVSIDTKLLSSTPARLSLALPGANVVINRRRDVRSPQSSAGPSSAAGSTTDSPVTTWVGEVVGARRATSSAVLIIAENGGVYGKITYFDRKTRTERTFTVSSGDYAAWKQPQAVCVAVGPDSNCMGQTGTAWQ